MLGRVILLFVLIFINGFFSCAESAVLQMGEGKIRKLAEDGSINAKHLLKLVEEPSRFLSTIQVAITLAGFLSSAFAAESFAGYLDKLLVKLPIPNTESMMHPLSIVLITLILSYISIVFGELVPKRLAQVYKEPIALFIAPVLRIVSIISMPIVFFLSASTNTDRQWRHTIHENRFASYPICGEDNDDIIGVLNTKDYFRLNDLSRPNVMRNAVDRPFFISQNMKVSDLFKIMQKERKYYGIVLDEYGGMTGIVTLHDLIEALVGDLHEEDELPEPEPIEQISENEWSILGSADLEDVNEALKIHLDLEAADTFGGYIMGIIGMVPEDGSSLHLDTDGLSIDVAEIKNHRIGKTIVHKEETEEEEEKEK